MIENAKNNIDDFNENTLTIEKIRYIDNVNGAFIITKGDN